MSIRSFDAEFYLTANPDVNAAILDSTFSPIPDGSVAEQAEAHFNLFGQGEQRSPNPQFDEVFYRQQNPDVAEAIEAGFFTSGFDHFQQFGAFEQRLPSEAFASFDEQAYLAENEDVAAAIPEFFESGFQHFLLFGSDEGRTAPGVPGEGFTLTRGFDEIGGTTANDTFEAQRVPEGVDGAPVQTLESFDELDGGGGTNRLNATLNGTDPVGDGDVTAPHIENIQELVIRSRETDNVLDMSNVSGAQALWNDRSNYDLTFANVEQQADIGLFDIRTDAREGSANTTVNYRDGVEIESQQVIAQGTRGNTVTLAVTGAAALGALALNSEAGENDILLDGQLSDVESLTITGGAALELASTGALPNIKSVDASNSASGLSLEMRGQTDGENLSVVLSPGDNILSVASEVLDGTASVLDGGAGNNVLNVGGADLDPGALDFTNVTNFQVLQLAEPVTLDEDGVLDLSQTQFTTLAIADRIDLGDNTLTVVGAPGLDSVGVNAVIAGDGGKLAFAGIPSLTASFGEDADIAGDVTLYLGDAESFTMNTQSDLSSGQATITGQALNVVNLNAGGNITAIVAGAVGDEENGTSPNSLNVADVSEEGDAGIDLTLVDTVDLTLITLTGGSATNMQIDATNANFDSVVTVDIGAIGIDEEGALTNGVSYTPAGNIREIFQFTGDDIGNVSFDDTFEGGIGTNADRLDFSQFAGVSSFDDLNINFINEEVTSTVEAVDDQFTGLITVAGVDLTQLEDNFIF